MTKAAALAVITSPARPLRALHQKKMVYGVDAAQAPPPRMPAPRRAREWAAAFGRGSFNASYSFGGAQRDGPFAYRAHAND